MLEGGVQVRVIQIVPDYHDVDIALRSIRAIGNGAIDEGRLILSA